MANTTMREAISQALWEEMERDPSVFIMGEEVGVWGGSYAVTKGFYDHFGARAREGHAHCRGRNHRSVPSVRRWWGSDRWRNS